MSKKSKLKTTDVQCTLPFGKYNESFILLKSGEKKNLKDEKSDKNSFMPIKVNDENSYNPYSQIIDTINYLQKDEELRCLVSSKIERHAFIVSPGRQKLPKGIETKERQLWQKLVQFRGEKSKISDLVHYVKVTKSDRFSNKEQIICSPKSPVPLPYNK